jgi:phosphatidylserine decarboxylase
MIAPEGRPFIAGAFGIFLAGWLFGAASWFTTILFGLFVFVVAFFRDPNRECPGEQNQVLCPADGRIVEIKQVEKDRFLETPTVVISIFMSPFNVHVNRAPMAGVVEKILYNPGKFFNAASEKASLLNEQSALFMKLENGQMLVANQIAGLVARRIVVRVKPGDRLARGERFGMIRFGSRVDLHLPAEAKITCAVGEQVFAGDTLLGELTDGRQAKTGK